MGIGRPVESMSHYNVYQRNWKSTNYKKIQEYSKKPKARFNNAKRQAKNRKLNWSLDFDTYIKLISQSCFYCDEKLENLGIGLDRISSDKSIGYILSNVVPCCRNCNWMKNDLPQNEFFTKIIKICKNKDLLCQIPQ